MGPDASCMISTSARSELAPSASGSSPGRTSTRTAGIPCAVWVPSGCIRQGFMICVRLYPPPLGMPDQSVRKETSAPAAGGAGSALEVRSPVIGRSLQMGDVLRAVALS